MQKKNSILILFAIITLSLVSLISFISAYDYDDYVYAGSGVVVYPDHIVRQVCQPFMPCGVQSIKINNYNNLNNYGYNYENENIPEESRDGDVLYDELSSPGFSRVIADQRSQTYYPFINSRNYNNYNNQNNYYAVDYGSYVYQENTYNRNPAPRTRVVVVYM